MPSSSQNADITTPLLSRTEKQRTEMPTNTPSQHFPRPTFARALPAKSNCTLPQTIAHRGSKVNYPENTLSSFRGAISAGAHALETDIHLTRDNVVVLSHDADLKRCFGRPERIIDCDYSYINTLRTTKAPHEQMPRLADLLIHLSQPENQHIWLLLDIKLDNNSETVMRLIAETLGSTPSQHSDSGSKSWSHRLILGIWSAHYLPLCTNQLPGYPVAYIGFSPSYARQFLKIDTISFNMIYRTLIGPLGASFIRDVKRADRPLFLWTVNDEKAMKWCIRRRCDGVITDDPGLFKEVCAKYDFDNESEETIGWKEWMLSFWVCALVALFSVPLKYRVQGRGCVSAVLKRRRLKSKEKEGHVSG